MDKETLSHYGWIVILVLILSVLLAFATPFGTFIADGFKATYTGLFQTGGNAMDTALGAVGVDTVPKPQITFDQEVSLSLSAPATTDKSTYTLSGTVKDDSGIKSFAINGTNVTVAEDSTWSTNLTLATDKVNEIVVVATNNKDKTTSKTIYLSVKLGPGLYQTGTNYTVLLKSWDELIDGGYITVENNLITDTRNDNYFAGDLLVADGITGGLGHFAYNNYITGITVPDSVTAIDNTNYFAFSNKLQHIILPSSITTISKVRAFESCTSLTTISFGENSKLETIADNAFYNCTSLKHIDIPDGVTSIGQSAFDGCSSLESIVIPDGVTAIKQRQFAGTNLKTVTIGKSVSSIDVSAFYSTNLQEIIIHPENATYIANGNCIIVKSSKLLLAGANNSVIPSDGSVTQIGKNAFFKRTGLTTIHIPDSVTYIDREAFEMCSGLTNITFGENSQVRIDNNAFNGCTSLESIVLPDGLRYMGESTFSGCTNLKSVTLSSNTAVIQASVFKNCTLLNSITYNGTVAQWNALTKADGWNTGVPATFVQCSDGQASLS